MTRTKGYVLVASVAALACALVVAVVPMGSAAAEFRYTPGTIFAANGTSVTLFVFNDADNTISVEFRLEVPSAGFTSPAPQTASIAAGAADSRQFACASSLGCSGIPIIVGPKKQFTQSIYYKPFGSADFVAGHAGDWKVLK